MKPQALRIETVPIAALKLDPRNARVHGARNLQAIRESLQRFGQAKPIVVSLDDVVIAGNGTLTAAAALGWAEVQIVRVDLDEKERAAFAIADNRTAELAEWDPDVLAETWRSLDAELQGATGILEAELEEIAKKNAVREARPLRPPVLVSACRTTQVVHCGDSLEVLRQIPAGSVHAIVTDPPYGLSFMGHRWDYDVPGVELWAECLRVLKPGGHLLAFFGTRTYHRGAVRVEDAGFEIRDMVAWVYGQGFPKSLDCSDAMERYLAGERQQVGGWGTALKPSLEPIVLARKPLAGSVAQNILAHGAGALNIDGCRVRMSTEDAERIEGMRGFGEPGYQTPEQGSSLHISVNNKPAVKSRAHDAGRWPANLIHDGSPEVSDLMPAEAGAAAPVHRRQADKFRGTFGAFHGNVDEGGSTFHDDAGSAARFFYCAKASPAERAAGIGGRCAHPTVKPLDLMRYLVRLVTPPRGTVLDPFLGSGTTLMAAALEGLDGIGVEREAEYAEMARKRISAVAMPLLEDAGAAEEPKA